MSGKNSKSGTSSGRVTKGLQRDTLNEQTLRFVQGELPGWRDDPERVAETSEERLNAQLCKYLNVAASERFAMVHFHHEERQTANRRVDFSALPRKAQFVGERFCTKYDPIIVFEGKRLPPPRNDRSREREYVTGGEAKSGGIQRFKLGLHGAGHGVAAMIGYIQEGEPGDWLKRINNWIRDLESTLGFDAEKWSTSEQLADFMSSKGIGLALAWSSHSRVGAGISRNIRIRHLWVKMSA
jgi:hypothetical protein